MGLVAMKQIFTRSASGGAEYPDLTVVEPSLRNNMSPDAYIGQWSGWLVNNVSGLFNGHSEGERVGVVDLFFFQWVQGYPGLMDVHFQLTETEFEDFYDNYHAIYFPDNDVDNNHIIAMKARLELMKDVHKPQQEIDDFEAEIALALDPENPAPGVVKNKRKNWQRFKAWKGIVLES
jgi:hypothetical protein